MERIFSQRGKEKLIALGVLGVLIYVLKDVMNIVLFTFLFTFLFYSAKKFMEKKFKISSLLSLIVIYISFLGAITLVCVRYVPTIINQLTDISKIVVSFNISDHKEIIPEQLYPLIVDIDIMKYIENLSSTLINQVANFSGFAIEVFVALTLSFFFNLESKKIASFMKKFEISNVAFIYLHLKAFGISFINTFGKVIKVQITISSVNAVLSFIGLLILGFPNLFGLTVMIFFLGLIPVAGVIISFVPLSIIAFNVGGLWMVVKVLIMILAIHAVENYFLNPKLYSVSMKLPIFFTFLILIVSEHIMGVWGLVLGIATFMFILDLMKISTKNDETTKSPK